MRGASRALPSRAVPRIRALELLNGRLLNLRRWRQGRLCWCLRQGWVNDMLYWVHQRQVLRQRGRNKDIGSEMYLSMSLSNSKARMLGTDTNWTCRAWNMLNDRVHLEGLDIIKSLLCRYCLFYFSFNVFWVKGNVKSAFCAVYSSELGLLLAAAKAALNGKKMKMRVLAAHL